LLTASLFCCVNKAATACCIKVNLAVSNILLQKGCV